MTKAQFRQFVNKMVDIYGLQSYLDNEDDIAADNVWCMCPYCEDVIQWEDVSDDETFHAGACPVCGEPFDF